MPHVPWVAVRRDPSGEADAVVCCLRCSVAATLLATVESEVSAVVESFGAQHSACTASVHVPVQMEGWSI